MGSLFGEINRATRARLVNLFLFCSSLFYDLRVMCLKLHWQTRFSLPFTFTKSLITTLLHLLIIHFFLFVLSFLATFSKVNFILRHIAFYIGLRKPFSIGTSVVHCLFGRVKAQQAYSFLVKRSTLYSLQLFQHFCSFLKTSFLALYVFLHSFK